MDRCRGLPRDVLGNALHNGGRTGLEDSSDHVVRFAFDKPDCVGYMVFGDGDIPGLVELASDISDGASEICDVVGENLGRWSTLLVAYGLTWPRC